MNLKSLAYEADEANLPEAPQECACKVSIFREIWGDRFFRKVCGADSTAGSGQCPKHCPLYISPEDMKELLEEAEKNKDVPSDIEDDIPF